jgi:hypothetical protein
MKQIRCFIFFTNDVIMSTINIKFVYCIKWNVYHSTDVYENNSVFYLFPTKSNKYPEKGKLGTYLKIKQNFGLENLGNHCTN